MSRNLYWVDRLPFGRVAIMPRPRGGDWLDDEILAWKRENVDVVVSLLMPDEVSDLELTNERDLCCQNGVRFLSFPITDRSVPESREVFSEFIAVLADICLNGQSIAVHCRQGIGRAAVVAICVLTRMGIEPNAAIELVGNARGVIVPETLEQRRWVFDYAHSLPNPLTAIG